MTLWYNTRKKKGRKK